MVTKGGWVLLALKVAPLDRIRLMKALFLFWWRSQKEIPQYFKFEPYLYGPYSLEVYYVLDRLLDAGLIMQLPHSIQQRAEYYLTRRGEMEAIKAAQTADVEVLKKLEQVVKEVARLDFNELLRQVYSEAPEYAVKSLVRDVILG